MSIDRTIIQQTSGTNSGTSQVFLANTFADVNSITQSVPTELDVPVYTINGATFNFYQQTTDGISASLNNIKSMDFIFSSNTQALSGTTKMKHDIYKIDYDVFSNFVTSPSATTQLSSVLTSTTGATSLSAASQISSQVSNSVANMISATTIPFYTVIEDVSGSTFTVVDTHSLVMPEKVKPTGGFTQNLFLDKSQYFVDSKFVIEKNVDTTVGAVYTLSGGSPVMLYNVAPSATTFIETSSVANTITGNTPCSGLTLSGATFTYFVPPKKPDINVLNGGPTVTGTLNTFAPIFSFKNVDDGDRYQVQLTYDVSNVNFTGVTTTFKYSSQPGNAEYIRTVASALSPNASFLYRIGNVKEIKNIFGTVQNITSYSEYVQAQTANDGNFILSGYTFFSRENGSPLSGVTLTLTRQTVNSSVYLGADMVDGGTIDETVSPLEGGIGTTYPAVSSSDGSYSFGRILGGQYNLNAYTGDGNYPPQNINIVITQDTNLDFVFSILWGNTVLNFAYPVTFL